MKFKITALIGASALATLTFGCEFLDGTVLDPDRVLDAIAQGPQPLPVRVPLVPVSGATAQRMEEFLVPGATQASQRLQDRCAAGEDVRHRLPTRYAAVEVLPGSIAVSGEPVVTLDGWSLRPDDTRGMLIRPVFERMNELAYAHKAASERGGCWPPFDGKVLLLIHPDTPFGLTGQVIYSLGQAQFGELSFAVADPATLRAAQQSPLYPPFAPQPAAPAQEPPAAVTEAEARAALDVLHRPLCCAHPPRQPRCHDSVRLTLEPSGAVRGSFEPGPDHPNGAEANVTIAAAPGGGVDAAALARWLRARQSTAGGDERDAEAFPTVAPSPETSFRAFAEAHAALTRTLEADGLVLTMNGRSPESTQAEQAQPPSVAASPATPIGADQWVAVLRSALPTLGQFWDECVDAAGQSYRRPGLVADLFRDDDDVGAALAAPNPGVTVSRGPEMGGDGTASGLGGLGSSSPASVQPEQVGAKVRIDTAATQWTGSEADTAQVERSLRRYTGRFKQCYERALGDQPSSKGRLVFTFEASAQRTLTKIELTEDGTGHEFLADCVHNALQRVRVSGLQGPVRVQGWALDISTE